MILKRIEYSLKLLAYGDALGVPFEIDTQKKILEKTNGKGIDKLYFYDVPSTDTFVASDKKGIGVISDDTGMTMATFVGYLLSEKYSNSNVDNIIFYLYMKWGSFQTKYKKEFEKFNLKNVYNPKWFDFFCHNCGAGDGTMLALSSGVKGTLKQPIYVKDTRNPGSFRENNGCAGMMRIAPIAWFEVLNKTFNSYNRAIENTAMTHANNEAQIHAGIVAYLIEQALQGFTIDLSLRNMENLISNKNILKEIEIIKKYILNNSFESISFKNVEEICDVVNQRKTDKKELFLSRSVFIQLMYLLYYISDKPEFDIQYILNLAVTQSGDSDSVGSILGAILGSFLYSEESIHKIDFEKLQCYEEINLSLKDLISIKNI